MKAALRLWFRGLFQRSSVATGKTDQIPEHLRDAWARAVDAPESPPPAPWRRVHEIHIGGLTDVGFARDSDLLLVVSHDGRGVLDCISGSKLARDRDTQGARWDGANLEAEGIGPLAGVRVRVAGIHGGGLARLTADGWSAERMPFAWPRESFFLVPPGRALLNDVQGEPPQFTKLAEGAGVRAFGFSPTGRTLVIAGGDGVTVMTRP